MNSAQSMGDEFQPEPNSVPDHVPDASIPEVSFWQWLRQRLGAGGRRVDRLTALDDAIVMHPESPSNYVLRGELYLHAKAYELAASDFEQASELIEHHLREDDWGIIAQSLQDRALHGLQQARRHLPDDLDITDFETGL